MSPPPSCSSPVPGDPIESSTEVLVVGGGPAGSFAAALLARQGLRVTLLEKERFPRYHIGESLLPSASRLLHLVGAFDEIANQGFQVKQGAYLHWGDERWEFDWRSAPMPALQVERARFDELLLRHARRSGAGVHEGVAVESLELDGGRPRQAIWSDRDRRASGEILFEHLIDASGRFGLVAKRQLRSRRYIEAFRNLALWGYWEGWKMPATELEGPILIGSIPYGWLWGIPLADSRLSVGLILHRDDFRRRKATLPSPTIYWQAIAGSPLFREVLSSARLVSELRAEADYSYLSETLAGPGFYLVGDAACFIDPLLSSGVHLAMYSALVASACVAAVARRELDPETASRFYQRAFRGNFLRWILLVNAFYQANSRKDSYFWTAHRLSPGDIDDLYARNAELVFSRFVSGLGDVMELERSSRLQRGRDRLHSYIGAFQSEIFSQFTTQAHPEAGTQDMDLLLRFETAGLTADHSVDDLFVVTEPRLGLARSTLS